MEILKKIGFILICILISIFSVVGTIILISNLQNIVVSQKDYLLFTFNPPFNFLAPFTVVGVGLFIILIIQSKRKINKGTNYEEFLSFIKRTKSLIILIFAFLLYLQATSISVFTDKEIIHHTFYNPLGTKYTYNDVCLVDTGVYGVRIPVIQDKGDLYYIIKLKDGTRINLMDIGEEKTDDTYSQIETIDKLIMAKKVIKSSSLDYIEFVKLDQIYIDRFKRIFENK